MYNLNLILHFVIIHTLLFQLVFNLKECGDSDLDLVLQEFQRMHYLVSEYLKAEYCVRGSFLFL